MAKRHVMAVRLPIAVRAWRPAKSNPCDYQYVYVTDSDIMYTIDRDGTLIRNFGYDPELMDSFCEQGSWEEVEVDYIG